jgi:LysM repeat protein
MTPLMPPANLDAPTGGTHSRRVRRSWLVGIFPLLVLASAAPPASAQSGAGSIDLANLHEDVRGLSQRLADLTLRVEQLEHDHAMLLARLKASAPADGVTPAQLNGAVADLNGAMVAAVAAAKRETLEQVAVSMEKLAKQTNAALDSLARSGSAARVAAVAPVAAVASAAPVASAAAAGKAVPEPAYSKEGISYTVQRGDTLGLIAKKTGGKVAEIVAANKLVDPSRIQVGQALFIPGGK